MMSLREEYWDINFRGVTIWPYLRFSYQGRKVAAYKNSYKFRLSAFLIPLLLLFNGLFLKRLVVAVTARPGLLKYVRTEFSGQKYLLVSRSEQSLGNSFFIEAIWFLFRKLSWRFVKSEYLDVCKSLDDKGVDSRDYVDEIRLAIGDYFYNVFISFFIRGRVCYTNCLIPKIERYMGLMDSVELQHGVIHAEHMDYAWIDGRYIKNALLVWNGQWKKKLRDIGYGGKLIVSNHDYISTDVDVIRESIVIFTTVDEGFSRMVDSYKGGEKLYLQKHPRDYYLYLSDFYNSAVGAEKRTAYAICHDTTLIFYFIRNSVFFVYLLIDTEDEAEVIERMKRKYDAVIGKDYVVSDSIPDAIVKIRLHSVDEF